MKIYLRCDREKKSNDKFHEKSENTRLHVSWIVSFFVLLWTKLMWAEF
jgi:hypothetical protein